MDNNKTKDIQVHELNIGDVLVGSKATVLSKPELDTTGALGYKNRMKLKIRYANGKENIVYWNMKTTIRVKTK